MECLENLNYFIRFFRNKTVDNFATSANRCQSVENNEGLIEKCVENWVIDGIILTLRVFVRPETTSFGLHSRRIATISVDRLDADSTAPTTKAGRAALAIQANNRMNRSMSRDKKRTATSIVTPKRHHVRNPSITSRESDELLRRRHQSTKASTSSSVSPQKTIRHTKETSQSPEEMQYAATPNSDSEEVFLNGDSYEGKFIGVIIVFIRDCYIEN